MTRYIAVPIEYDTLVDGTVTARLACGCETVTIGESTYGFGATEDEAFNDLLVKLRPNGVKTWKELE